MRGIIPGDYANGNSPVGGFVRLQGGLLEVEPPAGPIAHGREGAATHAVANLIRRAVEVDRRRPGIAEAARAGGWSGRPRGLKHLTEQSCLKRPLQFGELLPRQSVDKEAEGCDGGAAGMHR